MMGLLGQGWEDPQSAAIMALAGGLLQGNFGGGLLGANNAYTQAKEGAAKKQFMDMQMQGMLSEIEQRKLKTAQEQAALQQQQRIREGLPGLYRQPGMTGGQAVPQTFGGTDIPMFSKPLGAAPVQMTPGGFDLHGAMRLGITDPEQLAKYAALANVGRQKVARTVKGMGPDGKEYEYQVDEFGQRVGDGMAQWKAPHYQDLGGKVGVFDGYGNQTGGLGKTQTPDSVASNAVAWANNALTRRGQDMTDARARQTAELGTIPSGYRRGANGTLEFIPGGPADPNSARRAAPTEDERKAAGWVAQARFAYDNMEKAIKADPQAAKPGVMESIPGIPENTANMTRSAPRQQFNQAASSFAEAALRAATGAGVNKEEAQQKIRELTPQWGDKSPVIEQKKAALQVYLNALETRAGNALRSVQQPTAGGGADPGNDPLGIRNGR